MNIIPKGISFIIRLTHIPFDGLEAETPIIRDTRAIYQKNQLIFKVDFPELGIEEEITYNFQSPPPIWHAVGEAVFHRINFIPMAINRHLVSGTLVYLNNVQQVVFIDLTGVWKGKLHPATQPLTLP